MLAKYLRRWIGGVRLAMTLLTVVAGLVVFVLAGLGILTITAAAWAFLGSLVADMAVFIMKDSQRPAGAASPAYYDQAASGERIGGAD